MNNSKEEIEAFRKELLEAPKEKVVEQVITLLDCCDRYKDLIKKYESKLRMLKQ